MTRETYPPPQAAAITHRMRRAGTLISLAFLALVLRLWDLQILEGDRYLLLSQNNRLRLRVVEAPRGFLLDRHRRIIVENRPSFDAYITPEDVGDSPVGIQAIAGVLDLPVEEVQKKLQEGADRPYQPLLLRKAIDDRTMTAVEERKVELPGLTLRVRPTRAYPTGDLAAHLLGYVGEITREQLGRDEYRDFKQGERIGQRGIEARYDPFIRGVDGGEQVEVDARGRVLRLVNRIEPESGFNVILTLDKKIQEAAEQAFQGKNGAVVAMNPQTGDILAWISRPSYDPNLFTQRVTLDEWRRLVADPKHPFQNRPLQAQYPPGSLFKLIVALAGLEEGSLTPDTTFECTSTFWLGNHEFHNWKKGNMGRMNLLQAIQHSCNTYFYRAGLKIGIEPIARMAREFGLGSPVGAGFEDEASGIVPDPGWKARVLRQPWYPADTVVTSIGQGMIVTTPIQLLRAVSAIATGRVYRPHFVKRIETVQGQVTEEYEPNLIREVPVQPETLAFIRRAMAAVVSAGTGGRARVPGLEVAGKTGTAQVVRKGEGKGRSDLKDHGWFAGFAPVENPQVAVVVLVENGGFGGQVAAPVAKAIFEAAFDKLPPAGQLMAQGRAEPQGEAGD